ncbi:MAG: CHAT domain-containing protein [Acidobacteriota bacterium]
MKQSSSKSSQKKRPKAPGRPRLQVVATRGSITQVSAPVVVVGNYRGIAPLSATKALDDALNHWISRAGEQGMIGAGLGEVFFIPVMHKEHKGINADAVLLAGMGEYGRFTYHDLRYLAMNICYAVSALKINGFASVAIGSGEGGIEIEEAVKGLLSGICDALHHVNPEERIAEFRLVELDKTRYRKMVSALKELIDNKILENIDLKLIEEILPGEKRKTGGRSKSAGNRQEATRFVNRITIERGEDGYSFSALTNSAVVPVRKVNVQPFFTEGIATQLKKGKSQERFGLLLHKYIFPEDFERMIDDGKSLTLVVDGATAALPWEMACYGPKQNRSYFGRDLKLTRQFRTMLSGAPGIAPPMNESLRILVIADPASDNDLRLPGAFREGRQVVQILQKFQKQLAKKLDIEIVSCIGPEQCDPVEILALILNETFDILHYSGHGIYDEKDPNNSGWVFSRACTLSAREIFRARQVPRVVFANACFSAVCHGGQEPSAEHANQKLAGLAEAFFARGVQNYIGTGWAVDDAPAVQFAKVFYERALAGKFLGDALADARRKIFNSGSTWGAYQHYGQSNARLV